MSAERSRSQSAANPRRERISDWAYAPRAAEQDELSGRKAVAQKLCSLGFEVPHPEPLLDWVRGETILLCDLVIQNQWKKLDATDDRVIELSALLQRARFHQSKNVTRSTGTRMGSRGKRRTSPPPVRPWTAHECECFRQGSSSGLSRAPNRNAGNRTRIARGNRIGRRRRIRGAHAPTLHTPTLSVSMASSAPAQHHPMKEER